MHAMPVFKLDSAVKWLFYERILYKFAYFIYLKLYTAHNYENMQIQDVNELLH